MIPVSSERGNNFSFLLYPDSLPEYWKEYIQDTHVPVALSPCHNFDTYNEYDEIKAQRRLDNDDLTDIEIARLQEVKVGTLKKPHYHCIVQYGNGAKKSYSQVIDDFTKPLNAPGFIEPIKNMRGMFRYLCHLDNSDKYQYPQGEIRLFNGFDTHDYLDISNKELDQLSVVICDFIITESISSYFELEYVTRVNLGWHKYVVTHSVFFKEYFSSLNHFDTDSDFFTSVLPVKQEHLLKSQ